MGDELKVNIPLDYYRRIMAYVDLVDTEITGFAECDFDETTKMFNIGKVHLLDQEASGASVEMSEEKIADFTLQMINEGQTQLPRCWWHSHVNMNVFFSGTDETAIENLKNETFVLALVVNKKREMKADVMMWKPFPYRWVDLEVLIDYASYEIPEELKKEVEEKVKPEKAVVTFPFQGSSKKRGKDKGNKWQDKGNGVYVYVGKRVVRTLPKDADAAEAILWQNNLSEFFDKQLEECVWASQDRSLIYLDPWEAKRERPLFKTEEKKIMSEITVAEQGNLIQ